MLVNKVGVVCFVGTRVVSGYFSGIEKTVKLPVI